MFYISSKVIFYLSFVMSFTLNRTKSIFTRDNDLRFIIYKLIEEMSILESSVSLISFERIWENWKP